MPEAGSQGNHGKTLVVVPYKTTSGIWAFDHEHQNTVAEGLLNGTELVIDHYFKVITGQSPVPSDTIKITLSTRPFPEAITTLHFVSTNPEGTDYVDSATNMDIWLCPWLQGYFGHVPRTIYVNLSV